MPKPNIDLFVQRTYLTDSSTNLSDFYNFGCVKWNVISSKDNKEKIKKLISLYSEVFIDQPVYPKSGRQCKIHVSMVVELVLLTYPKVTCIIK
jgi:hypothetical protein